MIGTLNCTSEPMSMGAFYKANNSNTPTTASIGTLHNTAQVTADSVWGRLLEEAAVQFTPSVRGVQNSVDTGASDPF